VQFHSGHTYGGNPVACAAGVAALALLREEDLPARAATLGRHLLARLEGLAARWPGVVQGVRGIGLLAVVEFAGADPAAQGVGQAPPGAIGLEVAAAARRRGLLLRRGAGTATLGPPLVASAEELDWVVQRLDEAIGDACAPANASGANGAPRGPR
jgi:adenosylmethionine-8-amino-7-oxononanoate aminotransferase